MEKYDEITFGMFVEVFSYLPMFTIVNDAVMVVHGGGWVFSTLIVDSPSLTINHQPTLTSSHPTIMPLS